MTVPQAFPPQAGDLRKGHPDLCPGEGAEAFLREPYSEVECPVCHRYPVSGYRANVPGGGRVDRHYTPEVHAAYLAWFDLPRDQRRWPLTEAPPAPDPTSPRPGQLALFA